MGKITVYENPNKLPVDFDFDGSVSWLAEEISKHFKETVMIKFEPKDFVHDEYAVLIVKGVRTKDLKLYASRTISGLDIKLIL